jgi:hypothetical protein
VVRHFFRGATVFPAQHFGCGRATLLCGNRDGKGGGFFHIEKDHRGQWEYIASFDNVNWRTAADWGMWSALKYPSETEYNAEKDSWNYTGPIYLKNYRTGEIVKRAEVTVYVKPRTKNIVSAFPHDVKNY